MKYTKDQIEALTPFAEKLVKEINSNLEDNLEYAYGEVSKKEYSDYEKKVKKYIKENKVENMVEYLVEWGEINEVPFEDIEEEFEMDDECFGFPELPCD